LNILTRDQLVDYVNSGNKAEFVFFWGPQEQDGEVSKSCLCQWYESSFEEDGKVFVTAEHYMMYHKAILSGDIVSSEKILKTVSPAEAKLLGRKVTGFDVALWDKKKFDVVVNGNIAKFSQNKELSEFLINTGECVLVEASPVDRIWGIGLAQDNPASENPNSWNGLNLLGFALMKVREQLANQN